jgi:hypothetical protein
MNDWTPYQLKKLKELYPTCDNANELAKIIGRNIVSIYNKAFSLGLKRLTNKGNINLKIFGKNFRFKKGDKPWNKGMKGLDIGGKETRFKKGNIPPQTKYFGKPYLYTRIRNGNANKFWFIQELGSNKRLNYARFIWEQEHGLIPKDSIIFYVNGIDETKPPTISDMGIMTKSDNMKRNSYIKYPSELRTSMRLLKKLKKTINENGISNQTDKP